MNFETSSHFPFSARALALALPLVACSADAAEPDAPSESLGRIEVVDGLSVATPARGRWVVMETIYDDGNTELVTVRTRDDGEVEVLHHNDFGLQLPPGVEASCPKRCDDTSFTVFGPRWEQQVAWSYNDDGRPTGVGRRGTLSALQYAFNGVQSSRNACGMDDRVSATHRFLGSTERRPAISTTGCGSPDGSNVVGWGTLPPGVAGVACMWGNTTQILETDQLYSAAHRWYAGNTAPEGCSGRMSLRSVAAHEVGHSYGLNHSGCGQTMAPVIPACTDNRRRYGKGDIRGLRSLY